MSSIVVLEENLSYKIIIFVYELNWMNVVVVTEYAG